jgi:coenzyme F420-reducing hydrogenase beta subunit
MFEKISKEIIDFLNENELDRFLKKIWTYKKKCIVLEFSYKNNSFKFDVYSNNEFVITNVDLITRPSVSHVVFQKNENQKTRIFENSTADFPLEYIRTQVLNIIRLIDNQSISYDYLNDMASVDGSGVPPKNSDTSKTTNEYSHKPLKVGIMTLPLNKNYGGNLQAFAMMEALRKLGHQPVLVNRRHPLATDESDKNIAGENQDLYLESYGISKNIANSEFIDKYLAPITQIFRSNSALEAAIPAYDLDAMIVGSDQVWRAKYARTILSDFFFSFLQNSEKKIRSIAYAASFGADRLAYGDKLHDISALAKKIDAVSVREDSAVDLCQKQFGIAAQHVIDPTLLLEPDDYRKLFADKLADYPGNRLLAYVLDADGDKSDVIESITNRLSLQAFGTNGLAYAPLGALSQGDGDRSVEGWLASFHEASFVITDSFHGTVFSILFNKPFIAYGNPKRGLARFTSLLKMFGLEDRLAINSKHIDIDKMLEPIDWEAVNKRLAGLRVKSFEFLDNALAGKFSAEAIGKNSVLSYDIVKNKSDYSGKGVGLTSNIVEENPLNLFCTGCGVCVSESNGSLKMAWSNNGFLVPKAEGVIPKGIEKFCPFNTAPEKIVEDEDALSKLFLTEASNFDPSVGVFENTYIGYSKKFRPTSSSGGTATFVFEKLLQRGDVDYLFVVQSDGANGYRYCVVDKVADMQSMSKTRYYPVSMDQLFSVIDSTNGNVAVSGVACFIKAVRLKQHYRPEYRKKIPFLVGIICGGLKSRSYTDFLAQSAGISGSYTNPDYRVKDADSTASDYSFSAVDANAQSKSIKMQRVGNNWGAGLFKARACDFCSDVLTELADISLGDAWLPKYKADGMGNSVVVTRSRLADEIIRQGIEANELIMEPVPVSRAIDTQSGGFNHKRKGLKWRIWLAKYFSDQPIPRIRDRVLRDIPVTEALIQIYRERTRAKSLEYWNDSRDSIKFKKRMRSSRKDLKAITATRKDSSNEPLISLLKSQNVDPIFTSGNQPARRHAILRLVLQKVGRTKVGFGMLRAALFEPNAIQSLDSAEDDGKI